MLQRTQIGFWAGLGLQNDTVIPNNNNNNSRDNDNNCQCVLYFQCNLAHTFSSELTTRIFQID